MAVLNHMNLIITFITIFGVFISIIDCSPIFIWPLGNTSYTIEIVEGQKASNDDSQCGMVFEGSFSSLPYSPLKLDENFVDLKLEYSNPLVVEINDFSISMFVNPTSSNGCILHYQYAGTAPVGYIQAFKFFMDSGIIGVNFTDYSGSDAGILTLTSFNITAGSWYMLNFGRDVSNGKIYLQVKTSNVDDKQQTELDDNFPNNLKVAIPGILRVGSTFDNSLAAFKGRVTCISIDPNKDLRDEIDALAPCTQNFTPVSMNKELACVGKTATWTFAHFQLNGINKLPGGSTVELLTLTSCGGVLVCGANCLKQAACESFAVEITSKWCKMCKLYDRNDFTNNVNFSGMNYYIRNDNI